MLSETTAETEYVYDCTDFKDWIGQITSLRWNPFQMPNQSFTLKSITFELGDGTSKVFDFTVKGAYETYLDLRWLDFAGYGDPDNEADDSAYCYPRTSTQVSIETGNQISALAQSVAENYPEGRYNLITCLPESLRLNLRTEQLKRLAITLPPLQTVTGSTTLSFPAFCLRCYKRGLSAPDNIPRHIYRFPHSLVCL